MFTGAGAAVLDGLFVTAGGSLRAVGDGLTGSFAAEGAELEGQSLYTPNVAPARSKTPPTISSLEVSVDVLPRVAPPRFMLELRSIWEGSAMGREYRPSLSSPAVGGVGGFKCMFACGLIAWFLTVLFSLWVVQ